MESLLPYIQIIISILLIGAIIMQRSEASLGGAFGGSDDFSGTKITRRGFEKVLFQITIGLGILFAFSALVALLL